MNVGGTSSGCENMFSYTLTLDQGEYDDESEISAGVESSAGSRHVHEICIKTHAESMCFCALIMVGDSPRYGGIEMIAINHGGVRVYVHEWPR